MEKPNLISSPTESSPPWSPATGDDAVDYRPYTTMHLQVEGDITLLDDVVAQLKTNLSILTKDYFPRLEGRVIIVTNIDIMMPDKKVIKLEHLKMEFVEEIKRTGEGISSFINHNNLPIMRVYLYNAANKSASPKGKGGNEEVRRVKEFISSNYDHTLLESYIKAKKKLEDKDNESALKTRWAVFCVGRVPKAQQKKINFVCHAQ